ncbi:MAG: hypothetical protein AAGD01_19720 [Acidobacteriota bacterium]
MSDLTILPAIDRLYPYDQQGEDGNPKQLAYGLTFQLAYGVGSFRPGELNGQEGLLRPWTWDPVWSQVRIFLFSEGGDLISLDNSLDIPLSGPQDARAEIEESDWRVWKSDLESRYEEAKRRSTTTIWGRGVPSGQEEVEVVEERFHWPAFLGELSRQPWPLAQRLGLSGFIRLDTSGVPEEAIQEATRLAVAPILPAGLGGLKQRLVPSACSLSQDQEFAWIEYQDDSGAHGPIAVSAEALTAPIDTLNDADSGTYFQLGSLWVEPKGEEGQRIDDEDWLALMEERLAELLDLGPWLVRQAPEDLGTDIVTFAHKVLERLRAVSGPGIRPGAPGGMFLARASDWWPDLVSREQLKPLVDLIEPQSASLLKKLEPTWDDVVKAAVMGRQSREIEADGAEPRDQLRVLSAPESMDPLELLAQLRSVAAAVARPGLLKQLLAAQWRRIADELAKKQGRRDQAKALGKLADRLLGEEVGGSDGVDGVGGLPEGLDLRRSLLRDALGAEVDGRSFWTGWLRALNARAIPGWSEDPAQRTLEIALKDWIGESLYGALEPAAKALIEAAVATLGPAGKTVPGRRKATRGLTFQVDSITADPAETQDSSGALKPGVDFLERIQGVGLLLRREAPDETDWRGLCWAQAEVPPRVPSPGLAERQRGTPLAGPVLLPARLVYRDGLRDSTLTYDNQPLTAESPLATVSTTRLGVKGGEPGILDRPPLRFVAAPGAQMPGLAYGADYRAAAFLVSNCGALPPALAEGGAATDLPFKPRPPAAAVGKVPEAAYLPAKGAQYKHLRTLKVGALRILPDSRVAAVASIAPVSPANAPLELPPVPEGVDLRIRELTLEEIVPPEDPVLEGVRRVGNEELGAAGEAGLPCLLLAPQSMEAAGPLGVPSSFIFGVRPPAVDIHTWDRWQAFEAIAAARGSQQREEIKTTRQRVWASLNFLSSKNNEKRIETVAEARIRGVEDVTLDDPAVVRLDYQLVELLPSSGTTVDDAWKPLPWEKGSKPEEGQPGLGPEQAVAQTIRVQVEDGSRAQVQPSSGGSAVPVTVEPGKVYRLSLRAVLQDEAPGERFDQGVEDRRYTSPWHLLIEVAEPLFAGPEAERAALRASMGASLWRGLNLHREHPQARGELQVTLEPQALAGPAASGVLDRLRRQFSRAELLHQAWGWRGRPPLAHPDLGGSKKAAANGAGAGQTAEEELSHYARWELTELGDRANHEHRMVPMRRRLRRQGQGIADNSPQELPEDFIFREPLEGSGAFDVVASHHRFAIRAISRYAPLLPPGEGSVLSRDVSESDRSGQRKASQTLWRRLFVPCRYPDHRPVPVPKVRLVLPLTAHHALDAEDQLTASGVAGLLVVVDGGWFDVGGLGEELDVEVVRVVNPHRAIPQEELQAFLEGKGNDGAYCAGEPGCRYLEMGPDPILTGTSGGAQLGAGSVPAAPDGSAGVRGALDETSVSATFGSIFGPAGHHRDHTTTTPLILASSFVLRPPTIEVKGREVESDLAWWMLQLRFRRRLRRQSGEDLYSEWSEPWWTQLIPPLQRMEEDWLGGEVEAQIDDERVVVEVQPTADVSDAYQEPNWVKDSGTFRLFGVMTHFVTDAAGRPGQEAYMGVVHFELEEQEGNPKNGGNQVVARKARGDLPQDVAGGAPGQRLRLRLLEVQAHPDATLESDTLWESIFAPAAGRESSSNGPFAVDCHRARITRISAPLDLT